MMIRLLVAIALVSAVVGALPMPAWSDDTGPTDTPTPPPPPPSPAPPPPAPMDVKKEAEARWQEINAAVQSARTLIDKKQFAALSAEIEKIRAGMQWVTENPGDLDAEGVASLSGVHSHVREFCDMMNQESSKGNEMTIKLCYRKINEYVQSANTIYHAPPPPKPVEKPKPAAAPQEKPKAAPAAVEKPKPEAAAEAKPKPATSAPQASDTAVKATAKPKKSQEAPAKKK